MYGGWSHHCNFSLPMHQPLPPEMLGKGPTRDGPCAPTTGHYKKLPPGLAFTCLPPGTRGRSCQGWPSCACLQDLENTPSRDESLMPVVAGFLVHLLPPWLPRPRQLCHLHALSSPGQTQVFQGKLRGRLLWVAHMKM